MKKGIDCQVFEDQLDALARGELPEEGARQLQLHARACAACAGQLRIQEHLVTPSLEELEAQVPAELVASIWPRLQPELTPGPGSDSGSRFGNGSWWDSPRFPWLVPAMAAATVVLVLTSTALFAQLKRVEGRERALAEQVHDLAARTEAVERTAALGERSSRVRALVRRLSTRESVSLASLEDLLRVFPEDTPLFDASQMEGLRRRGSPWTPAVVRRALAELGGGQGVRVGDLLAALESIDIDPETQVPTARLIDALN